MRTRGGRAEPVAATDSQLLGRRRTISTGAGRRPGKGRLTILVAEISPGHGGPFEDLKGIGIMSRSAAQLREEILDLVHRYHAAKWPSKRFEPGETGVPVSGKVFDHEE